jgi:hypothetical protein
MRDLLPLSCCALLFWLTGCATPQSNFGLPSWDYMHDELHVSDRTETEKEKEKETGNTRYEGASAGVIAGILLGNLRGISGNVTAGAVAGIAVGGQQDGIELSAPELNTVILRTLTPHINGSAQTLAGASSMRVNSSNASWTVSDSNDGQITTDWKRIPGRKVGVLWWHKEYETQVHHIITIKQSFRSARLTNYAIVTEVRERPNENYDWTKADPELGRQSFEDIKGALLSAVQAETNKRRPKK